MSTLKSHSRWLSGALLISVALNMGAGYYVFQAERRSRQALAYPAELVSFHMTQLARFADPSDSDWENSRTRLYDSVAAIVDFGRAAQRIPVRGLPYQVGQQLGELAERLDLYRDEALRISLHADTAAASDRIAIQKLAEQIKSAGWDKARTSDTPVAWTYGRDWSELSHALDSFLTQVEP